MPNSGGGINTHWRRLTKYDWTKTPVVEYGVLKPGVYDFSWSLTNDLRGQGFDESIIADYVINVSFERCHTNFSSWTPTQPFRTIEEAAQAALEQAWKSTEMSAALDVEWGGYIYSVSSGGFRFVPPLPGERDVKTNLAFLSGAKMFQAYAQVAVPTECSGTQVRIVANYHTHPPTLQPSYLSINDINAAVQDQIPVYKRGANW